MHYQHKVLLRRWRRR